MPAVSKAQRRLFAIAYKYKKGEIKKSELENPEEIERIAKSMSLKKLRQYAKTKEKKLPKRKRKTNESFVVLNELLELVNEY